MHVSFQQHIDVIRMECVDYDHAFVHDLESRSRHFPVSKPTKKPPKSTSRKSTGGGPDSNSAFELSEKDPDSSSRPSGLRRSSRIKQPSFRTFFASSDDAQSSGTSDYDLFEDLEEG